MFDQIRTHECENAHAVRTEILKASAMVRARDGASGALNNLTALQRGMKSEEYEKRFWNAAGVGDVHEIKWLLSQRDIQFDVNKCFRGQSAVQVLLRSSWVATADDFIQFDECLQLLVKDPRVEFNLATEHCNVKNRLLNRECLLKCIAKCDMRLSRCKRQFCEIAIGGFHVDELQLAFNTTRVLDGVDFVPQVLDRIKHHIENVHARFISNWLIDDFAKLVDVVMSKQNQRKAEETKSALESAREIVRKQILPTSEVRSVFLPFVWPVIPLAHVAAAEVIIQQIEACEFDLDTFVHDAGTLKDCRNNQEELLLILRKFRDHLQKHAEFDPASVDPKDLEVDVPLV